MLKSRGRSVDAFCNGERSDGLKSEQKFRWNAVCEETRMHGAEWGKIWSRDKNAAKDYLSLYMGNEDHGEPPAGL